MPIPPAKISISSRTGVIVRYGKTVLDVHIIVWHEKNKFLTEGKRQRNLNESQQTAWDAPGFTSRPPLESSPLGDTHPGTYFFPLLTCLVPCCTASPACFSPTSYSRAVFSRDTLCQKVSESSYPAASPLHYTLTLGSVRSDQRSREGQYREQRKSGHEELCSITRIYPQVTSSCSLGRNTLGKVRESLTIPGQNSLFLPHHEASLVLQKRL